MKVLLPDFASKSDMFDYLVSNKKEIINLKKSVVKEADSFGITDKEAEVVKALNTNYVDADSEIKRTIVGNTYNWMDSHEDSHLDNCFGNSIAMKGVRAINHFHDHIPQISAKVGIPETIYEKSISWTDLGINKAGQTMALFMDSLIKRSLNQSVFDQYKEGLITQHSVGMQYVNIMLGINDPDRKEEYGIWNQFAPKLGNYDKAEKLGFCFFVKEAKLIEISCVIAGSNELTGTLPNKGTDPSQDSQETDPDNSQSKSVWDDYIIPQKEKTIFDYLT